MSVIKRARFALRIHKTALSLGGSGVQIKLPSLRLGTAYGGWTICPEGISSDSIVYSFGVGEDISFDLALIERYGLNVYAFDPTPKSIDWLGSQKLPNNFHFYDYGIADFDGIVKFNPPENPDHVSHTVLDRPATAHKAIDVRVHRLKTIMDMLGHRRIDILKMDVEGAEYRVVEDLINHDIDVSQILIEFHHRFANVGEEKTEAAIEQLNDHNYRIFDVSPSGEEYAFIRH